MSAGEGALRCTRCGMALTRSRQSSSCWYCLRGSGGQALCQVARARYSDGRWLGGTNRLYRSAPAVHSVSRSLARPAQTLKRPGPRHRRYRAHPIHLQHGGHLFRAVPALPILQLVCPSAAVPAVGSVALRRERCSDDGAVRHRSVSASRPAVYQRQALRARLSRFVAFVAIQYAWNAFPPSMLASAGLWLATGWLIGGAWLSKERIGGGLLAAR